MPITQLEDYRRILVRRDDNSNENITDNYFALNKHPQHKVLAWTGETWFDKQHPG